MGQEGGRGSQPGGVANGKQRPGEGWGRAEDGGWSGVPGSIWSSRVGWTSRVGPGSGGEGACHPGPGLAGADGAGGRSRRRSSRQGMGRSFRRWRTESLPPVRRSRLSCPGGHNIRGTPIEVGPPGGRTASIMLTHSRLCKHPRGGRAWMLPFRRPEGEWRRGVGGGHERAIRYTRRCSTKGAMPGRGRYLLPGSWPLCGTVARLGTHRVSNRAIVSATLCDPGDGYMAPRSDALNPTPRGQRLARGGPPGLPPASIPPRDACCASSNSPSGAYSPTSNRPHLRTAKASPPRRR